MLCLPSGEFATFWCAVISFLKFAFSAAVLVALLMLMDREAIGRALAETSWLGVAVAAALFLSQVPLLAARWQQIVIGLRGSITYWDAVRITLLGRLFNQILPTSIGGDVVRSWSATKVGLSSVQSVQSVLIERITGMLALLVIVAVTYPLAYHELNNEVRGATFVIAAFVVFAAAPIVLLVGLKFGLFPSRVNDILAPVLNVMTDVRLLVSTGGLAIVSNGLAVLATLVLAQDLGLIISVSVLAAVVTTAILLSVVPVSFGGWGVREGIFVGLLALFGVANEQALLLSLLFGLALFIASLVGLFVWLKERKV